MMDNLPAHKAAGMYAMIGKAGAILMTIMREYRDVAQWSASLRMIVSAASANT